MFSLSRDHFFSPPAQSRDSSPERPFLRHFEPPKTFQPDRLTKDSSAATLQELFQTITDNKKAFKKHWIKQASEKDKYLRTRVLKRLNLSQQLRGEGHPIPFRSMSYGQRSFEVPRNDISLLMDSEDNKFKQLYLKRLKKGFVDPSLSFKRSHKGFRALENKNESFSKPSNNSTELNHPLPNPHKPNSKKNSFQIISKAHRPSPSSKKTTPKSSWAGEGEAKSNQCFQKPRAKEPISKLGGFFLKRGVSSKSSKRPFPSNPSKWIPSGKKPMVFYPVGSIRQE